eukprot:XP_020404781.1 uncharacterized protein LOC109944431 [Zea mays]
MVPDKRSGIVQSLLKYNPDGSLVRWEYSNAVARTELCRLIAREDLPLWFGESDAFQEYITKAHNPKFVKSSRQTTARDLIKLYNERVLKLIESFKSVSSVALTSDIWNGKAKEDYISVVAHFVNSNWELEKRLIGLRLIDVKHSGNNIAKRVNMVADEYDPRAKMRGFHKALQRLSAFTGTDYSRLPQDVRKGLTKLYQIYDTKFGDVRLRVHEPSSTTERKNKSAWDDIYGDDDIGSGRRSGSGSNVASNSSWPTTTQSELSAYLDSDTVNQFDDSFSILGWWHGHKLTYHVLSILAKDVMTVPASTISSESTFSLVGRVIKERRRWLTSDMVEVLSCIKDWELADLHMQHNLEKDDTLEIESVLESLNNDGGQQGSQSRAQE